MSTTETPESLGIPWSHCIIEDDETGCWLWIGAWGSGDYGCVRYKGRSTSAHRAVYQFVFGDLPSSVVVDHLCRVHPCVNPYHLEAVSQTDNILRGNLPDVARRMHSERTHCKHGHPLSGNNVRHCVSRGYPNRACRTCARLWMRRARAKAKK